MTAEEQKCSCGCAHDCNHEEGEIECGCAHDHAHDHACSCAHDHAHDQAHDHACGCSHDHAHDHAHSHAHPSAQIASASINGGIVLYKLSTHEGAQVLTCTVELEDATMSPACLSKALQSVAFDVERAEGIVGHIKCSAVVGGSGESEKKSAHISVTASNVEPTVIVEGLDTLDEDTDINIVVIAYMIDPADLLDMLLTRLERIL